jgi:hypothetical protein
MAALSAGLVLVAAGVPVLVATAVAVLSVGLDWHDTVPKAQTVNHTKACLNILLTDDFYYFNEAKLI